MCPCVAGLYLHVLVCFIFGSGSLYLYYHVSFMGEVLISMGIRILLGDWRSPSRQIRRKESDGMRCGLVVFGYSPYPMGCHPFHSQSLGCSCLLWTCRRCGSTCYEHPRIKVDASFIFNKLFHTISNELT